MYISLHGTSDELAEFLFYLSAKKTLPDDDDDCDDCDCCDCEDDEDDTPPRTYNITFDPSRDKELVDFLKQKFKSK